MNAELRVISSLSKIRYQDEPCAGPFPLSGFQGETLSFQAAYRLTDTPQARVRAKIISGIDDCIRIRRVCHVPVRNAAYPDADEHYISKEPGLYPDLLTTSGKAPLWAYSTRWETLWIDVETTPDTQPGLYPVRLMLTTETGVPVTECTQEITVLRGTLPVQRLRRTEWFHCDCLAAYYHVPVFSEDHWQIIENFAACAVRRGINTLLMPVHTPPLDTRIGGERLTTQLVGITIDQDGYHFDMTNVRRWIDMCRRIGVTGFEVAHLFTQWGAAHAPKIVASADGCEQRIFGWETDATGHAYRAFLEAYIPALRKVFEETGITRSVIWHISDEPNEATLESYLAAKRQVEDLLDGCVIMDALSHIDFYQRGIVAHPIAATDHIEPFIEAKVPDLWAYYCCSQYRQVANRFIAMPSVRSRMLAVQLYLYRIAGFLQWGFNFYHNQYSDDLIDPYATTDADGWVPAGDPFSVYPGADGRPEESIRLMVLHEAMQDLRAMDMLEALAGRDAVCSLIGQYFGSGITFSSYPLDADALLRFRAALNEAICRLL